MITILAVDDNPNDLFFMTRALSPSAVAHRLITAGDGVEARECLQNMAVGETACGDLIVFSDVDMPRQGGLQLLQWIKEDPRLQRIPVVMVSSFENQANVARAFELGAIACLPKPPDPKAVSGLLQTITGQGPDQNRERAA